MNKTEMISVWFNSV